MYYSEVFLEEPPDSTKIEQIYSMNAFDSFIIKGKITGQQMGAGRPSPVMQVESIKVLPEMKVLCLKFIFIIELIISGITLLLILRKQTK